MSDKQDLRVKKTKRAILQALLELVKEDSFSRISIRDLCERAEINRGTFYLHYQDKFDLLERTEDELLEGVRLIVTQRLSGNLTEMVSRQEVLHGFGMELLTYVDSHAEIFEMLLLNSVSTTFEMKLKNLIRENFMRLRGKAFDAKKGAVPVEYLMAYVTSGHVGLLQQWLSTGRQEKPEQVAGMLVKIMVDGPMRAAGVIDQE